MALPAARLLLRYYMYKKRAWQYFLIDFCYAVNFLAVLSMVVLPSNRVLFEITFVAANGQVLIAILAWRNSLVFHSLDKVTTLFIHAFPPMYTWAERWYGRFRDGAGVCSGSKALFAGFLDFSALDAETDPSAPPCSLTMTTALGWPILAYMVWQVLYLVKTELLDGDRISQDPSLLTSSRWFITARKGMLYNAALSVARATGLNGPDEHFEWSTVKGKAVFVVSQLIYTIVTMLPAKLMYESWAVHSLVLVAILANSLWNGASYYFEVFSLQYQARLQSVLDAADGAEKKAHGTHSPSKASGEATSPDSGASEPASSKSD